MAEPRAEATDRWRVEFLIRIADETASRKHPFHSGTPRVYHPRRTTARRDIPMRRTKRHTLAVWLYLALPALAAAQPAKDAPWFRDATADYGTIGSGPAALVDLDGD